MDASGSLCDQRFTRFSRREYLVTIRWDVEVQFARRRPSPVELIAVRQADPNLRDKSIHDVREVLENAGKDNWTYRFSAYSQADADKIVEELRARGLTARIK